MAIFLFYGNESSVIKSCKARAKWQKRNVLAYSLIINNLISKYFQCNPDYLFLISQKLIESNIHFALDNLLLYL